MGPAQAKVQQVKISPEAVDPEDIETLEDLILAAVNEALSQAQRVAADKVAPLTGGVNARVALLTLTIEPIARTVEAFASLPGIGPGLGPAAHLPPPSPARRRQLGDLAEAILHMKESVHFCSVCGNVTDTEPCSICRSDHRDRSAICVVEDPLAIVTLERTRVFKGLYHVLHGALDPLHGVSVDDLKMEMSSAGP